MIFYSQRIAKLFTQKSYVINFEKPWNSYGKTLSTSCLKLQETKDKISPNHLKTMAQVIDQLVLRVGASKSFLESYDRKFLMNLLPTKQSDLPPRRMKDSEDSAIIPLGSDLSLREKYINFHGGVRIGRILEDLDVFAVWLCYNHIHNPLQKKGDPSPYFVVTALVDRIDFHKTIVLRADKDIKLKGQLSWVGTSSMEATIFIEQLVDNVWTMVTRAVFVMVARDPVSEKAAFVNPLVCETQEEKVLFQEGQVNKLSRKMIQQESLFKAPPSESEKTLVHDLFINMADPDQCSYAPTHQPDNSIWIEDSKLKNLIICHPEHRNRFGKIFGGFIMRQAFELAWGNALVHSKQRPHIIHIDDIMFRKPVDIGSLLYLNAQIVYTEENHVQVSTKASVVDPVTNTSQLTNIFHFTFEVENTVATCIPKTYHGAMMYLDGRRHYQLVRGIRKFYSQGESVSDQPR